jgi:tetratricopeptide (TPR) repeat protein
MKNSSSLTSLLVLSFLAIAISSESQVNKSSTPAPPSNITRPDSIQNSGFYGYWTNMSGQSRAGGALYGKVNVEGESLLWDPIPVSVICNGTTVSATRTDASGKFLMPIVPVPGYLSLQGDQQRQMETHYEGCTVQASFTGFHSNAITITQHNLRDEPDLGTITLSRAGGRTAATAVSNTIESAPANAVKAFDKARTDLLGQNPDHAQKNLEKAVQAYPGFAAAWYQLGRLQEASNAPDAQASFSKAAAADPQFILPYEQLAALSAQTSKWQDVLDNTGHTLQLDPAGTAQTWYLKALASYQLGKMDAAETSSQKSLAMDPTHSIPNTEQLLAVILAGKADYNGALQHLRNCLKYTPSGPATDLLKQQITQLEKKAGVQSKKQ